MTTVTGTIFTPKIDKELSKFPPEIVSKIQQAINSDHCYLDSIWSSQLLIHTQKMVMLYLSSVEDGWVSVLEVSTATSIPIKAVQKILKNLIKIGYIESNWFSMDLEKNTAFEFILTQKIIEEYLVKLIRDFSSLKGGAV